MAESLVAEARRARQPEALALALRALAWAHRARLDDRSAIRLLDEACRIARRHHLGETLAELLISHAAVSQELGRMAVAQRDLDAAATLVSGTRTSELDFQRAVLLQNIGRLADAAAIYQHLLAGAAASPRRRVQSVNNLALIESQQGRYGPPTSPRPARGSRCSPAGSRRAWACSRWRHRHCGPLASR